MTDKNFSLEKQLEDLANSYTELVDDYCDSLKEAQENLKELNRLIIKKKNKTSK
ncbi:hypothetical protein M153_16250001167 [Pseudoloma neurophilia]|uniref:Uncharacterized protein n=1 Tax=Pseudoloma neurophilia TaxID=146866 RepID=A0A0R0LUF5_9MICR|nr:hypothetical protein M153_16250001167 [Pseudoloma neurophilia]